MADGDSSFGQVVRVSSASPDADILVVCEHASNRIPAHLDSLGLPDRLRDSHIAWDPGAEAVAEMLSAGFGAPLVAGGVSRLVYDCNRPPESADAVPERSEIHDIPGNAALVPEQRQERAEKVYAPFRTALSREIARRRHALDLIVTVHSFTPVYKGTRRDVEIGIVHGRDDRFATGMICSKPIAAEFDVRLNEPYGAEHGVAHTLDIHGHANGLMNVMIEIRNDLIANETSQRGMAHLLADWILATRANLGAGDAA